jgi:nucleoside-diphosphate-sugar epimerase
MGMKILITGHKGFVGRNFVKALPDSDITGIDIKDGNDCRDFFKTNTEQYDLVIHLAAIVGGRATIEGEPLSVATDLSIDAEFFNWVQKTKPINTVYFSSSAAYPIDLQNSRHRQRLAEYDLNLDAVRNPDLTYGWAKLTGEYLAQFLEGTNLFVFRPFSGYGSDQDSDYPFPASLTAPLLALKFLISGVTVNRFEISFTSRTSCRPSFGTFRLDTLAPSICVQDLLRALMTSLKWFVKKQESSRSSITSSLHQQESSIESGIHIYPINTSGRRSA